MTSNTPRWPMPIIIMWVTPLNLGTDALNLKPIINGDVLDPTQIVQAIFENLGKTSTANLAYSAHAYLARGLASLAVEKAEANGVKAVGFSGGAACNEILAKVMRETVEAAGLTFLVHESIPSGDGGGSFGQAG